MVYANFSAYAASELHRAAKFYPEDIAGLAWAARNLFELHLIIRFVALSEENPRSWIGQRLNDEKDFIEGVLTIADAPEIEPQVASLKLRRAEIIEIAKRHSVPLTPPYRIQKLAALLGEEEEYAALFKLFSKYVHPSSLVINFYALLPPDPTYLDLFLIKVQVYAGQAIGALQRDLSE